LAGSWRGWGAAGSGSIPAVAEQCGAREALTTKLQFETSEHHPRRYSRPTLPRNTAYRLLRSPSCRQDMVCMGVSAVASANGTNSTSNQPSSTLADNYLLGPSRCFPFWQELLACYVVNTSAEDDSGKKKCAPALEDYYECLHHKKEVRTNPHCAAIGTLFCRLN